MDEITEEKTEYKMKCVLYGNGEEWFVGKIFYVVEDLPWGDSDFIENHGFEGMALVRERKKERED